MNRLLAWAVIVLGAFGMTVLPRVVIEHCPECFAERIHRIVGVGVIQAVFFAITWTQVRRLRAMRDQR